MSYLLLTKGRVGYLLLTKGRVSYLLLTKGRVSYLLLTKGRVGYLLLYFLYSSSTLLTRVVLYSAREGIEQSWRRAVGKKDRVLSGQLREKQELQ